MTTQKRQISEFAEPGMGGAEQGVPADMQSGVGPQDSTVDREGAMAKADLFKLASYSHKLYEKIGEEDQLEAWVQAKITKAADYIASVYHYLEYEMKFTEYGHHLDNSDTLSESQRHALKTRLDEAKAKMKELKIAHAEKIKEGMEEGETCPTCNGTGHVSAEGEAGEAGPRDVKAIAHPSALAKAQAYSKKTRAAYAAHKRHEAEEESIEESFGEEETPKERKEREAREKAEADKPRTSSTGGTITKTKHGLKHTAKSQVDESEYGWDETPKEKKEREAREKDEESKPRKSSTGGTITKTKHGLKHTAKSSDEQVDESKPSAGLSKAKKSATVKKAKKGGDIGKPGKGFKGLAAKAAKEYGSKEKGEKVAAAAMWKNIKETTAYIEEKKAATKDLPGNQEKIDADHDGKIEKSDLAALRAGKKETVKESADLNRMKQFLGRLLG